MRIALIFLLSVSARLCLSQVVINEICPANGDIIYDPSYFNFSGWVELYNKGAVLPVDLGGYYLSDDSAEPKKWSIPPGTSVGPKGRLLIWCSGKNVGLRTNFELDSEGEEVIFSKPDGSELDKIVFPKQFLNVSYGRTEDGGTTIGYLLKPSPMTANIGDTGTERLASPNILLEAGRYGSAQSVTLTHSDPNAEIRFTTDGSEPNDASQKFTSAFTVSSTSTVKAKAFKQGFIPSETEVKTFFINEHTFGLPVVSISMDQSYLSDNKIGIYVEGTNGTTGYCQDTPRNWNQDWDRHATIEFFDKSGMKQFGQAVDIRIGGNCSRSFPLKPFVVKARDEYGKNTIDQKLFDSKEWTSYGGFMLRNAGNDFFKAMFRDALMQTVVKDQMDVDYLAYQPKAIWLNGQYWGILNLREKIDADYFKTNFDVDKKNLDLGEKRHTQDKAFALEGSIADFHNYVSTLALMDISSDEAYDYIENNIDVDEFVNYLIAEIYYGNVDWPWNNIKFWRTTGGRWRWVLWDLDFGMGLSESPTHGMLDHVANSVDQHMRLVLQNQKFREKFMGTFAASLSTTFKPDRVIGFIDEFQRNIKDEMPFHTARWGQSMDNWNNEVQSLRNFATQRNVFMQDYLGSFFGMSDKVKVNITAPVGFGKITFNGITTTENIIDAPYVRGLRYTVVAQPLPDYEFSHWNISQMQNTTTNLIASGSTWRYHDSGTEPPADWRTTAFDDSGWASGNAQLGYGDGDEKTVVSYGSDPNNKYVTTYFRRTFDVGDTDFTSVSCKALFDDGVVIYLNGAEVYRRNMPDGTITGSTLAAVSAVENIYESFIIPKELINSGSNTIAVEIHQISTSSSDISFDLELSTMKFGDVITSTSDAVTLTDIANSDISLEAVFIPLQPLEGLVINEFSVRESKLLDERQEAEDWIEIYNNGTRTIDLGGLYITDDLSNKLKHQIKFSGNDTRIAPGEYKILYADNELFDGPLHLNFKLSADGESIGLYQRLGNDLQTLDQLTYDSQPSSGSYSRIPNATGPFLFTGTATPEATNIYKAIAAPTAVGLEETHASGINLFPNPTTDRINVTADRAIDELIIISVTGQVVAHCHPAENIYSLDVSGVTDGVYFALILSGGKRMTKKIVKMSSQATLFR